MNTHDLDPELKAIQAVIDALEPLEEASRNRVIEYAFDRLGLVTSGGPARNRGTSFGTEREGEPQPALESKPVIDVRTLREEKEPQSANEMAALVAYYLAEMAPETERKAEVTTNDIKTYFKLGKFPLPNAPQQTLRNAAAAGYFESAGGGKYRLNPVGHNLVAHNLPRKGEPAPKRSASRPTRARAAKPAKKSGKQTRTKRRASGS